jgi:hypothetical protein
MKVYSEAKEAAFFLERQVLNNARMTKTFLKIYFQYNQYLISVVSSIFLYR